MRWPTRSPTALGRRLTRRRSYAIAGRADPGRPAPRLPRRPRRPLRPQTPAGGETPRLEWWSAVPTPAQQGAAASLERTPRFPAAGSERASGRAVCGRSLLRPLRRHSHRHCSRWRPDDLTPLTLANVVQPLDSLVRASRYDLKAFMPPALQPCYGLDDQLYALPEGLAITLLFFNRRFLQEAGIDYRQAGLDFRQPAQHVGALPRAGRKPGARVGSPEWPERHSPTADSRRCRSGGSRSLGLRSQ